VNARYDLTPQMLEYDRLGTIWLPYLMFFHSPNYASGVVNTDSRGFRLTHGREGVVNGREGLSNASLCLFVGGSSAFGVGASSDRFTIPSLLNQRTHDTWVNYGGRAFSSTQELLLVLLYSRHRGIEKVIIFSGVNDLILFFLADCPHRELGAFFSWNRFNQAMNQSAAKSWKRKGLELVLKRFYGDSIDYERITRKELLNILMGRGKQVNPAGFTPKSDGVSIVPSTRSVDDVVHLLHHNLSLWKQLSVSWNFKLTYVLQPLSDWLDRKLSHEEEALFNYLSMEPANIWQTIQKHVSSSERYAWYVGHIRAACYELGIDFFDMNKHFAAQDLGGRWLFVDRVHLGDAGNCVVADALTKEVLCD